MMRYVPKEALKSKAEFGKFWRDPAYDGFLRDGTVSPFVYDDHRRDPWVWFGSDNLAPERWRELADNCVPLARCHELAALFIAGKGVKFINEDGSENEQAQARFQEWVSETSEEEFMERIASDLTLLGAFAFDVTPLRGGRRVGRIRHRDAMRVRLGHVDEDNRISTLYWAPDWVRIYNGRRSKKNYVPTEREALDLSKFQPDATAYVKAYKQGRDYYGEPWWLSAVPDAEVWAKVPIYNRTQMDTGFRPVVHLHMETEKDPNEIDKLYDDIVDSYTGSSAQGVFLTFGRKGENVQLNQLERGDHAGELDEMRNNAEKCVVRACGVSPIIYGLDGVSTGMDGASQALEQAVMQFQRTFVEPRQKIITRTFTKLMEADGIEVWDTVIEPLDIIDAKTDVVQNRQAYMRSVTVNEHRELQLELPPIKGGDMLLSQAEGAQAASAAPAQGEDSADVPEEDDAEEEDDMEEEDANTEDE